MIVTFYNGSKTKEAWNPDSPEFIDDWKPETLAVKCESLTVTYGSILCLWGVPSEDGDFWRLEIDKDGFVQINDVYYGDWSCK